MAWTADRIARELWELLAEPSDLDPSTAPGFAKLLIWINEGQRRLANYKFPDGHIIRFPCLNDLTYFNSVFKTGTLSGGAKAVGSVPAYAQFSGGDPNILANDNEYVEWTLEITGGTGSGQTRLITGYVGGSKIAYVAEDWATAPDATSTYRTSKRWYLICAASHAWSSENVVLDPVSKFVDLLGIWDITNREDLARESRSEIFLKTIGETGKPTSFYFRGNRIVFNYSPIEVIAWRLEYYRQPVEMVVGVDLPEIPDAWHQNLALAARWFGFCRAQETGMSYSAKRDFHEAMQTTRQSMEMSYDLADSGVMVDRG